MATVDKEFMESWMQKCNPDLIVRYWRFKGSPGKLTLRVKYGLSVMYINTIFGELCIKVFDIYKQLYEKAWWKDVGGRDGDS